MALLYTILQKAGKGEGGRWFLPRVHLGWVWSVDETKKHYCSLLFPFVPRILLVFLVCNGSKYEVIRSLMWIEFAIIKICLHL
jgi:hypothetical protein